MDTENRQIIQWPFNSIFRAPAHIRSGRESIFEPKLVSIGPYYHGRENLKRMEDLKFQCMSEVLVNQAARLRNHPRPLKAGTPHRPNRSIYNVSVEPSMQGKRGIDDVPFEQFMDSGEIARAYYKQEFDQSDVEFVQMLVIDSCFIIRTILSLSQQVQESMAFLDVHVKDVKSDLLLLENQIPLFFIRKVYEWLFPHRDHPEVPPFETVLEPFICLDMPWRINYEALSSKAAHLLDLYWRCSLSPSMYKKLSEKEGDHSKQEVDLSELEEPSRKLIHALSNSTPFRRPRMIADEPEFHRTLFGIANATELHKPMMIANATELHKRAGVEFEKFNFKSHLDVIFSNGIMQMPRLKINARQTTLFVNVIAFENCILPSMRSFSCYMKLMDALIDSDKDVELLQQCGVIYNTLSSHEKAATFFNDIGNICFIDNKENRFSGLYKNVQRYYKSGWHRRSQSLKQNYFSSPWAGISVAAGVILLILSALQTVYTIYGYYNPKK